MAEPKFQYSDKIGYQGIFVVRGDDYVDFSNNIMAVINDNEFAEDMEKLVKAIAGVNVGHEQAIANVQASVPQAQPVQQGNNFSCPHGPRTFKEGRSKNGGTWQAYFCALKGSGCKPMSPDGTLWN